MALKAASNAIMVQPSLVDNNETRTQSGLFIATEHAPARKVWCGVIEHVGAGVEDGYEVGHVAHYTDYVEIQGMHLVPEQHVIAYET